MKQVLGLFAIILVSVPVINAEEKSWYEIDGIRIRSGYYESYVGITIEGLDRNSDEIMSTSTGFFRPSENQLSPFSIEFPETLMNSWSYRGLHFSYNSSIEHKDLVPNNTGRRDDLHVDQDTKFFTSNRCNKRYTI